MLSFYFYAYFHKYKEPAELSRTDGFTSLHWQGGRSEYRQFACPVISACFKLTALQDLPHICLLRDWLYSWGEPTFERRIRRYSRHRFPLWQIGYHRPSIQFTDYFAVCWWPGFRIRPLGIPAWLIFNFAFTYSLLYTFSIDDDNNDDDSNRFH